MVFGFKRAPVVNNNEQSKPSLLGVGDVMHRMQRKLCLKAGRLDATVGGGAVLRATDSGVDRIQ